MAALPYMQLYVADYLGDTYHLTTEEHGAYLLLIMTYWQSGKPIQEKHIQTITRLDNERITNVITTLREFFNVTETGLWVHDRIEHELAKVKEKSIQCSKAGRKAMEKRWGNKEKVTNVITDVKETLLQNHNHTDTDTDTDTDTEKIKRKAFIPPTLIQIQSYCSERKNNIDPVTFINHYQANGWFRGKAKVKDWKACVRTWEKTSNNDSRLDAAL